MVLNRKCALLTRPESAYGLTTEEEKIIILFTQKLHCTKAQIVIEQNIIKSNRHSINNNQSLHGMGRIREEIFHHVTTNPPPFYSH